jgi:hypothetical protein
MTSPIRANIRATPESVEALRRLAGRLTAETGRTITQSEALAAACAVAASHLAEAVSHLPTDRSETNQ